MGVSISFDVSSSLKKQKHTFIRQVLNVEDCNLDSLLGQQLYYDLANTVTASRHNDNLATPHIFVFGPVVGHSAV